MSASSTRASKLARLTTFSAPSQIARRPSICLQCQIAQSRDARNSRYYHPSRRRDQSALAAAVSAAKIYSQAEQHAANSPTGVDPLRVVAKELKFLTKNIRNLLGSGHPMLDTVAKYYTQSEGKYVRPMLVLLMSRATACITHAESSYLPPTGRSIDSSISPRPVLNDLNPDKAIDPEPPSPYSPLSSPTVQDEASDEDVLPSQRRLAEITELIHTASLLHDDVLDTSVTRRSQPSANVAFGNKMAVLAGDFLLGRASVALARLRDPEVVELLASVIANLVEGEFMQLRNTATENSGGQLRWSPDVMEYYLQKTYLKSASLISKSCRAAALLGPAREIPEVVDAAYQYGKNLGLAFQLVDDMLDYTVSGAELGKPAGADLQLGLATAPLIYAWEDDASLGALVSRHFVEPGDVQRAHEAVVSSSTALIKTRQLAQDYVDRAIGALSIFPDSEAKTGLIEMCEKVLKRRK